MRGSGRWELTRGGKGAGWGRTVVCAGGQGHNKSDKAVPLATDVWTLSEGGGLVSHVSTHEYMRETFSSSVSDATSDAARSAYDRVALQYGCARASSLTQA